MSHIVEKYTASKIVFELHGDEEWGPTNITEYWNGIDPPASGYTIYTLTASRHEPSIVVAHNDDECIWFARSFGGVDINTAAQAIHYLLTGSTGTTIINSSTYPGAIIDDGLLLHLDPAIYLCYPKTGTHADDLKHSTGWNFWGSSITYNSTTRSFNFDDSSNGKYIITDENIEFTSSTTGMTYDFWCYQSSTGLNYLPSLFWDRGQFSWPFVWIYSYPATGYIWIQYGNTISYTAVIIANIVYDVWRNLVVCIQYGASGEAYYSAYVNGSIYVNHQVINEVAYFPNYNCPKTIGSYGGAESHNWNGKFGPIKIYNKVLSYAEVLQNYHSIKSRFGL